MTVREWQARRAIGEDGLTLAINPMLLQNETRVWRRQEKRLAIMANPFLPAPLKRARLRIFWEMTPFIVDDDEFERHAIRGSERFRLMADIHAHRDNLAASDTFAMIRDRIREAGAFSHKSRTIRQVNAIEPFISECYLDLITSMETEGYQDDKTSDWATGGTGTGFIDADGTIVKCAGATHRLAAAILAGLDHGFPLRIIGIHREWAAGHGIDADLGRLPDALRAVEAYYRGKTAPGQHAAAPA